MPLGLVKRKFRFDQLDHRGFTIGQLCDGKLRPTRFHGAWGWPIDELSDLMPLNSESKQAVSHIKP